MDMFLKKLVTKYVKETPSLHKSLKIIKNKCPYHPIPIDHIAFRTFNLKQSEEFLLDNGFERKDRYDFPDKYAFWYKSDTCPFRIFLSEFKMESLGTGYQLLLDNALKYDDHRVTVFYDILKNKSDYAAWTYQWSKQPFENINHIAFATHYLPSHIKDIYRDIKDDLPVETFQVSKDKMITQFSTKADMVDGYPKSFVEFIERSPIIPSKRISNRLADEFIPRHIYLEDFMYSGFSEKNRKDGFDVNNASKIFNSTNI